MSNTTRPTSNHHRHASSFSFHDARDEIIQSSSSDCGLSEYSETSTTNTSSSICSSIGKNSYVRDSLNYDFWIRDPKSIDERRDDFIRRSGFSLSRSYHRTDHHHHQEGEESVTAAVAADNPPRPPVHTLRHLFIEESNFDYFDDREGDDDDGEKSDRSYNSAVMKKKKKKKKVETQPHRRRSCSSITLSSASFDPLFSLEEFYRAMGIPDWLRYLRHKAKVNRNNPNNNDTSPESLKNCTVNLFRRLTPKTTSYSSSFNKDGIQTRDFSQPMSSGTGHQSRRRPRRINVHAHKKRCKDLSCLYQMQEISSHEGCSILTMKFSVEGDHLATGGEDGIIHIRKVIQDETSVHDFDMSSDSSSSSSSSIHGTNFNNMDLVKGGGKEKGHNVVADNKHHRRKSSDSASSSLSCCNSNIVIPKKVPKILKKAGHDYHGHEGPVLDLSWSTTKFLLSCSVDKTVRLWRIGCDLSIRVFQHREYVTCVEFNPVNDNYFASGSVDRIVRIWCIKTCKVVQWIDLKDVVTAICYQADDEGIIVGSRSGRCHFYEFMADDSLRLKGVVSLQGNKKSSSSKRINSIQVSPSDPSNVVVTALDSHIWILNGRRELIYKLKGLGRGGTHLSAYFTSDGEHVISTNENHEVHIWNCSGNWGTIIPSKPKTMLARESFFSPSALVSVPWHDGRRRSHQMSGTNNSKLWGLIIVSGGSDGQIRTYHNYGLPLHR